MTTSAQPIQDMPRHHVGEETILAYAAGTLDEAEVLVVSAHLTLCPHCRASARAAEAVGGALLEAAEPVEVAPFSWDRADAAVTADTPDALSLLEVTLPRVTAPYMPKGGAPLRWRFVQPGVTFAELYKDGHGVRVGLIRAQAGVEVTSHSHSGEELSLVLSGGYFDGEALFRRGDVQVVDENHTHAPATDKDEGCLLLVLMRGPIRPTGWIAKIVSRLIGF